MSDIHTARVDFLASLRVRNNLEDEDVGVNSILDALNTEDPRKAIRHSRTIRMKEQLAFLAFIDHLSISEAQRMYRGVRVADLTETIINKVIHMSPCKCNLCDKIYEGDNEAGDNCYLCSRKMCPDCVPVDNENRAINKVLFPICSRCIDTNKKNVGPPPPLPRTLSQQVEALMEWRVQPVMAAVAHTGMVVMAHPGMTVMVLIRLCVNSTLEKNVSTLKTRLIVASSILNCVMLGLKRGRVRTRKCVKFISILNYVSTL